MDAADSVMELVCSQLNLSLSSADFNIKAFAAEDEMVTALMSLENSTQMNTCFHSGAGELSRKVGFKTCHVT